MQIWNMKAVDFIIILLFTAVISYAQSGSITNIQVSQRTDGSGLVDVYFMLTGSGSAYNLSLEASFDGGGTYTAVPASFLSGDLSNISPGSNKHIVWDGLGSFPGVFSSQTQLKPTATDDSSLIDGQPCPGLPIFIDERDGQQYTTVLIGEQCWMRENHRFLPQVFPSSSGSTTAPRYYVYGYEGNNVTAAKNTPNFQNYGVLYNWSASVIACPPGWRLPEEADWVVLFDYLFETYDYTNQWNDPGAIGNQLKSCRQVNSPLGGDCSTTVHPRWNAHSTNFGVDSFNFSFHAGGCRSANGWFEDIGDLGNFWTATEFNQGYARGLRVYRAYPDITQNTITKMDGLSLRCIKIE